MILYLLLTIIILLVGVISYLYYKNKKLSLELKFSQDNFDYFFDSSLEGIIIWDEHKTIKKANQTFIKLSGYDENEIIGKNIFDFIKPEDYDVFNTKIFETQLSTHELNFTRKDDSTFLAQVSKNIFTYDRTNTPIWFIVDLSTIKQKEIELEHLNHELEEKVNIAVQANREKDRSIIEKSRLAQLGEMISMIAHQWRQPLTAISATCNNLILQSMTSKKLEKDDLQHELQLVTGYTKYLSETIDDFRNFFKKNKYKEETTVDQIINETLHIISSTIQNNNIDLVTILQADTKIETFEGEVKQVILNIMKNAQDALKLNDIDDPKIIIETYFDKNYVIIEITDNAKGIPLNIIGKIFEPYFSTKKELDGTGLGLYMSKIIVEKNCDGKLLVANKGDGAVFTIKLPLNKH